MRRNKSVFLMLMKCLMLIFLSFMLYLSIQISYNIVSLKEKETILFTHKQNSFLKLISKITKINKSQNHNLDYSKILLMSQRSNPNLVSQSSFGVFNFCGKDWTVYLFAFTLGAFWNVKQLKKIGVV